MSEKLLTVSGLSVTYASGDRTVRAVNSVSLDINRGETLGLVGETGAGKTTFALSLMRLLPKRTAKITSGSVEFEGIDILSVGEDQMRSRRGDKIAMIFQDPMTSLDPVRSVGNQIGEALRLHSDNPHDRKAIESRVEEMLETVGIPATRKNEFPHQFSGGMKQRVLIAMALSCSPELLIADEPITALDVTIQAQVLALMGELQERMQMAMRHVHLACALKGERIAVREMRKHAALYLKGMHGAAALRRAVVQASSAEEMCVALGALRTQARDDGIEDGKEPSA